MNAETKVILSVLLVLAGLEAAARVAGPMLSADVRQIIALDGLPAKISGARARGRSCFLVVGNSLAKAAIHRETLEAGLRRKGWPDPEVFYLTPDASGVNEWTASWRKHFPPEGGVQPDFLILVTGRVHLLDDSAPSPEKLGAYHAAAGDRAEILWNWLPGIGEKVRFVSAIASRLFANRERVRPLLFYRWIPGYEETAQRLNRRDLGEGRSGAAEATGSVVRFRELLGSIKLPSDRVVVVAAPLPDAYRIPGEVKSAASQRGIPVIEEVSPPTFPASAFPAGFHLGPDESVAFTARLVREALFDFRREGASPPLLRPMK